MTKTKTPAVPETGNEIGMFAILSDVEKLKEIPIETVEKLYELSVRSQEDRAKQSFFRAFAAVQREMTPVLKSAKNKSTNSLYARADDVKRMLDPILQRHGFSYSCSSESLPDPDSTRFLLIVRHEDGYSETHSLDAPIDYKGMKGSPTKTKLQGLASSYTYCERHLLCKVFGVQLTEDTDGNEVQNAERVEDEEVLKIEAMINDSGTDMEKFKRYFKIKELSELTRSQYPTAIRMLEQKIKETE